MTARPELADAPPKAKAHIRAAQKAEREGRLEAARGSYEQALRSLHRSEQAPLAAALFRWIAWTHSNTGDPEAALDCLEVAEAVAEACRDHRGLASVLNTRAGTLFNMGELDEAEQIFGRVRELAGRIRDRKLQAMAEQNLGSVASIRGDLRRALVCFRSSLDTFHALGLELYLGPLLNNIGRLQIELGEDAEADATLTRARELCLARGDRHHHIVVEANRARLLLKSGRLVPALKACEEARELMTATGDSRWAAEVNLVTGSVHARLGKPEVALDVLERAAEMARARRDAKVLADILLEQAGVLRDLGRNRETLLRLNEAHATFRRLRAQRELANVDTRLTALEGVFIEIVKGWGESIESKDSYTQGHCARVAEVSCRLALEMGVPDIELTWFRMGALLHDVGKVAVPEEVLKKAGPLDEDEWRLMARHPVTGVELLEGVDFPLDIRPMIRHHHERWDGTGYPDRLAGEAIPREARILTIADVYDALTTDRPYRPGYSHERALDIMNQEQGRTLDPHLFTIFQSRVADELGKLGPAGLMALRPMRGSATTAAAAPA